MDRYEELKEDIQMRKSDCEKNIKSIQEAITNATFDNQLNIDYLYLLAERLRALCRRLTLIEGKYKKFMLEEERIRKMLDGFCETDSFIYESIELRPGEDYPAKVGYKFFETIEEAKAYSISLGEREDWLNHTYAWLSED